MPLIRINAACDRPKLHDHPAASDLRSEIARRDPTGSGPIIIMTHGYKYAPGHRHACPHRSIFTRQPGVPASWPRALGFGRGADEPGLGIAFGWHARGTLYAAQRRTPKAGRALRELILTLKSLWPDRPVHVMAHSMGSELFFHALPDLPPHSLHRAILMTSASFLSRAEAALASDAGRTIELINVTSRENDLFDFLCERMLSDQFYPEPTLGHGLKAEHSVTLQLDCPVTLNHLSQLGRPIEPPRRRICHWSSYSRRGILRFYGDLLRHPDRFPLDLLRQGLPPSPQPRWSRLLPDPNWPAVTTWRRLLPDGLYGSAKPRSATT